MRTLTKQFVTSTTQKHEIIDVSGEVNRIVQESGIQEGLCLVHSVHTTAGVLINEHDEGLKKDIIAVMEKLAPADNEWQHNHVDPNAEAHLKRILTGRGETLSIRKGRIELGTWEHLLLAEWDGPRKRTINVKIIGE